MSYQPEERYWTDYLRIALPIGGLLLLLGVFWYWASSFIGDDTDDPPQTPEAAVVTTPITAPTATATVAEMTLITPQTVDPTEAAEVPSEPTQADQGQAEPTATSEAQEEPTSADTSSGRFEIDQIVIVNTDDLNMRAEPTTDSEIVDVLPFGAELRILDDQPTEGEAYLWWNVEDTLNGTVGWVADEFIDAQE